MTIAGIFQNEDVDYYAIEAKKGERLTVEIEGMRLGNAFFDPYVAILNKDRFELVTSDDTALLLQDSIASMIVPEDGTYIIQARESSYVGNGNCHYRMHVGHFPRPTIAFPAGGQTGQDIEIKLLGDKSGDITQTLKLPAKPTTDFPVFAQTGNLLSPSPNPLRVRPYPNVFEAEPNANQGQATPTKLPLPLAFNGVISEPGDQDWYAFDAKKGQKFTFRVHARSIRSPLDPVFNIWGHDKKYIGGNDDSESRADSKYDFTAAADGTYTIRIMDHLKNGGPEYVYRVEAEARTPSLALNIPPFARNNFQSRQMIYVARGNRFATLVNATRSACNGDLAITASNLPTGVTLKAETMPGNINSFPILFEAAPDAPIAGTLADLTAKLTDPKKDVSGGFFHKLDLVMGNPNNTVYYQSEINQLAVAVVEEIPFHIEIEKPNVPLVQNGTLNLKIKAIRKEGFDAPITVRNLWNPPGIGSQPTMVIAKGQTEIYYTLNANGEAQAREWKLAMMAESDAGQGQILAASALTPITVAPPYISTKLAMTAIEQGKPGEIICTVENLKPFKGKAKIQLYGLPAKTTTTEQEITKDTKEIRFPITTAPDSPKGQHKNLFCHIEVPEAGTTIPHNTGHGGVLRIDPPPPVAKDPAPKKVDPKVAAAPKPAAAKPLSRLEQLRQEKK
ncbi:MAG: PPC domain-containing protein [Akkermansiaceae bacterium]